jgi:hypothetical protein
MPTISEQQLSQWTAPAFENEDARREDTEKIIREAIAADEFLSGLPLRVYAKGSTKNNTNVRRDSDVDVAVEYTGAVFFGYWQSATRENVWAARGINPYAGPLRDSGGHFQIARFKDAIAAALNSAFDVGAVTRSNKVFTVRQSSRSLAADVIPCVTFDQHWSRTGYAEGIQLLADRQPELSVVNFPQQHYDNGVAKNKATNKRFKSVVRILKNLENQMVTDGESAEVAGYLVESLVFNCPDPCFNAPTWAQQARNVIVHIWKDTEESECEKRWMEVNGIKYLFHASQRWTREQARRFVWDAWQYIENS